MASVTYLVDGVGDGPRRQLTSESRYRPGLAVRGQTIVVPGRHGSLQAGPLLFEASTLSLEWEVWGSTVTQMEAERAALVALLANPGGIDVVRRLDGAQDQVARCDLKTIADVEAAHATAIVTISTVLDIPGTFWRDPAPTTSAPMPAETDVTAAVAALAGGSGPITDAVVRVQGPCTAVHVVDVATGTGLSWTGALAAGEYLFMDAGTLTARKATSATAWSSGGAAVSGALDYPGPGPLSLWPRMAAADPTDRQVTVKVTGTGRGPTTAVTIHARRAYL